MDSTSLLSNENESSRKSWSITQKYEAIIVGDAYCGKTTYLNELIDSERMANAPIMLYDDNNRLEFCVEYKKTNKKAIFIVRDTANQEKFRSLTQTHYRKAQCAVLAFDVCNLESFYSLPKWYMDIFSYCNNQANFAIVLVGIKKSGSNSGSVVVSETMIEQFQIEHEKVINYCLIDLTKASEEHNFKEPFEILLKYFINETLNGRRSVASLSYNNYSSITRSPPSASTLNPPADNEEDETASYRFNKKSKKTGKCLKCSIL